MTVPNILLSEPVGAPGTPVLVLGHSLGTGPLIWENAVALLVPHFRVALVTLPGHGDAPVPGGPFTMAELASAIAEATRELLENGERAFYAGVSIGGALALELGVRHSDVFAAVASLASGAELGTADLGIAEHWQRRAALVREQSTSVLIGASSQVWFAAESIEREPVLVGRILHALRDTNAEGYARCAEALAGYDLRAELGTIEVPVLALWGEHDAVGTVARQDEIVAAVPKARKVRIDGAAHQPPAERPAETAAALIEFFESVAQNTVAGGAR